MDWATRLAVDEIRGMIDGSTVDDVHLRIRRAAIVDVLARLDAWERATAPAPPRDQAAELAALATSSRTRKGSKPRR